MSTNPTDIPTPLTDAETLKSCSPEHGDSCVSADFARTLEREIVRLKEENEKVRLQNYSYCNIHKTYPEKNEPCWMCVNEYQLKGYEEGKAELTAENTRLKEEVSNLKCGIHAAHGLIAQLGSQPIPSVLAIREAISILRAL